MHPFILRPAEICGNSFPLTAKSKDIRCHGHTAAHIAVNTMFPDLQMIIFFSFKSVGTLLHFLSGFQITPTELCFQN